jgi:ankyrin repeat protein
MCAIYGGAQPVVKLLLDRGADPNLASREGFTVLHFLATKKGSLCLYIFSYDFCVCSSFN